MISPRDLSPFLLLCLLHITWRRRRHRQPGGVLRQRRRELALLPDAGAVLPESDGDGHERQGDEAEQRARPLDAEAVEHVGREEREHGAADGAQEGVGCDGGGGAKRAHSSVLSSFSLERAIV